MTIMKVKFQLLSIILFFLWFVVSPLNASAPREGGGANAQTQALIQQLGMERTRLNAENAKLKKQVKELENKLESATSENQEMTSQLGSTQKQLNNKSALSDELRNRLETANAKLQELIAKFRETIVNLRQVEDESEGRRQSIVKLEQELNTCATNNLELSKLGYEVLDNYESKGFWDKATQNEPFTQIKRVQIENLVDDYTYLIEDQEYNLPETSE